MSARLLVTFQADISQHGFMTHEAVSGGPGASAFLGVWVVQNIAVFS